MSETRSPFVISRDFEAPRPLLFSCFTQVDRLARWWGPKGFAIVKPKLDFRPGGQFHYGMQSPSGQIMWGLFVFREIVEPQRIVFLNSFSNEAGEVARAPFYDGKWPLEMLTVFDFEDLGPRRSRFTLTWSPHNATAEEIEVFASNHASAAGGWAGSLEKLSNLVAVIKEQE